MATSVVIALVVIALLRWIAHLMSFGRIPDTLDRVEESAAAAFERYMNLPCMGGAAQTGEAPADAHPVLGREVGYVQHIDMARLSAAANRLGGRFWLAVRPGTLLEPGVVVLVAEGPVPDADSEQEIAAAFACGRSRTFEQDPRFGPIVLSEIASRALSPAVNDPGTAIDVLGRLVRVLSAWRADTEGDVSYPDILVPRIDPSEFLDDAFRPIARDGAGLIEVQIRLQKSLRALAWANPVSFGAAAGALSAEALGRAEQAGLSAAEMARLRKIALPRAQPAVTGPPGG